MLNIEIRPAVAADAAQLCSVYNGYVATTTITFEETPVAEAEMAGRIRDFNDAGPALARCDPRRPCGRLRLRDQMAGTPGLPAFGGKHGVPRPSGIRARCWGTLYRRLLNDLSARGLHTVIAGIAQPNARSVALHERLGFRKVAHFEEVGFKLDQWVDVAYWQRSLAEMPVP